LLFNQQNLLFFRKKSVEHRQDFPAPKTKYQQQPEILLREKF